MLILYFSQMEERTKSILEAGLRDYIKTGEPITSERLYHLYDFGIKPAMIRRELNLLSDAGYLSQPHPSAGRLPTDKAYRLFIEKLLSGEETKVQKSSDNFKRLSRTLSRGDIESFVEDLSGQLKCLSIGYDAKENDFWQSGLETLLAHLDFETKADLLEVVKDFELLPERLSHEKQWFTSEDFWPRVFVGESPVTRSEQLSVLAGRIDLDGEEIILMTIGPKRMDYEKPIQLFKYLNRANNPSPFKDRKL